MNFLTEKVMESSRTGVFALADVLVLLGESRNSVRNIVKRAIAAGEIIHLRRGLYCLADKCNRFGISRNMLANLIYGPSYVSMEAARRDVLPFVYASDRPSVDLWSRDFFTHVNEKIPWRN